MKAKETRARAHTRDTQDQPRAPRLFQSGARVLVPDGKTKDGDWSGRVYVIAVFAHREDAEVFAVGLRKRLKGATVTVRVPEVKR